jgi:hypothetical protein
MATLTKQTKEYLAHRTDEARRAIESAERGLRQSRNILREIVETINENYYPQFNYVLVYAEATRKRW